MVFQMFTGMLKQFTGCSLGHIDTTDSHCHGHVKTNHGHVKHIHGHVGVCQCSMLSIYEFLLLLLGAGCG